MPSGSLVPESATSPTTIGTGTGAGDSEQSVVTNGNAGQPTAERK